MYKEKAKEINFLKNVFLSDKDKAKLNIQFLDQINPKSKYQCKNELIYTDQRF